MSTNLYLKCLTHQPNEESHEIAQHLSGLPEIFEALQKRKELASAIETYINLFHQAPYDEYNVAMKCAHFFHGHPDCDLKIVDEYGDYHYPPDQLHPPIEDWKNPKVTPTNVTFKVRTSGHVFLPKSEIDRCHKIDRNIEVELVQASFRANVFLTMKYNKDGCDLTWRPGFRTDDPDIRKVIPND